MSLIRRLRFICLFRSIDTCRPKTMKIVAGQIKVVDPAWDDDQDEEFIPDC